MASETKHILVVDDDDKLRELVSRYLEKEGFTVSSARDGVEMDALLESAPADLIVLDLMLPGEDGLSIARRLRSNLGTPIIILSARGDDVDRIVGLEVGADDYLPKPFNPRELLARIRAVFRRVDGQPAKQAPEPTAESALYHFSDFTLDLRSRRRLCDLRSWISHRVISHYWRPSCRAPTGFCRATHSSAC